MKTMKVNEEKNPSSNTSEFPKTDTNVVANGKWVLKEELASKQQKRPIYFWKMTAIGPCSTANPNNAARFGSKQEAMTCPAYSHALSFYEPEQHAR